MPDRLQSLSRELSTVNPPDYRTAWLFATGAAVAAGIHAVLIPLFTALHLPLLAVVNVGSVAVYLLALWLTRWGQHLATIVLAEIELVVHQALVVWLLGWHTGFQYYILVIPGMIWFLPPGRTWVRMGLLSLAPASYLALLTWSHAVPPRRVIDPDFLWALEVVNIGVVFGLLALFAFTYARAAEQAEARLEDAHARAQRLLHNILPVPIAQRLQEGAGVIADGFATSTVLFADIVGFTDLSASVAPERVVGMLDAVFCDLDRLADEHGLEKIKTIGDAYMVAAGVPEPRADHADAIAEFALQMREVLAGHLDVHGAPLRVRVGINSGPVVAGVIGRQKFSYDLWGDSVNTAARMESHGVSGEIQVSESTWRLLRGRYTFVERGEIEVKGKGRMRTWLLVGRQGEEALPVPGLVVEDEDTASRDAAPQSGAPVVRAGS